MTRTWTLGDVVPLEPKQPIIGRPVDPVWHILVSRPRQEADLRRWLDERGVTAWYPETTRQRAKPSAPGGFVVIDCPAVSGYVLARFEAEPQWAAILGCRHVSRYVTQDERPVVVRDAEIAQMAEVPAVLVAIKMAEEARRAAERAAHAPVKGQMARIETGIMAGMTAPVADIRGAYVDFEINGLRFKVHEAGVRRVAAAATPNT